MTYIELPFNSFEHDIPRKSAEYTGDIQPIKSIKSQVLTFTYTETANDGVLQ